MTHNPDQIGVDLAATTALSRDVRKAEAAALDRDSAMMLVDLYYRLQEHRIATGNQVTALAKADRPTAAVEHFHTQIGTLERDLPKLLGKWAEAQPGGQWTLAQLGIGPIIAAALFAHIRLEEARTVGSIWRFAGLDPSIEWNKGQKRPYNARLKVLCWKIGDSFVKVSGRPNAFYGRLYRERKHVEVERNIRGQNSECAAATLEKRNIKDRALRELYESGQLPPGRLDLRARRWSTKLFLAHWHDVCWRASYDTEPPKPYVMTLFDHVHEIRPPAIVPDIDYLDESLRALTEYWAELYQLGDLKQLRDDKLRPVAELDLGDDDDAELDEQ